MSPTGAAATPLKCGSAPAGSNLDPSNWRVSPLRRTAPRGGIVLGAERTVGVLHRIDSQVGGFHHHPTVTAPNMDRVDHFRCPSCRLHCQLVCSNCVSTTLLLGRIRDVNHQLFLRKAEACQRIEQLLQLEMNFQADMQARERSIRQIRERIASTSDSINRLKRSLAVMGVKMEKSAKNVKTLEGAALRHAKLIEENAARNQRLLATLQNIRKENFQYNRFYSVLLAHYFQLKKHDMASKKQKSPESMLQSLVATIQPAPPPTAVKVWPPVRNYYFTLNGCEIQENGQYGCLEGELVNGSSTALSKRARPSFAALLYLAQFLNTMAYLIDFNFPYKLTLRELATCNRWSQDLFATDVFRLDTNVMALCAACGLRNEVLAINNPFNNVHLLIQELHKNKITTTSGLLSEQMKHKILEAFKAFNYEERQQEFDLKHVDDDWVSVDFVMPR